jgi:hypothetical protein
MLKCVPGFLLPKKYGPSLARSIPLSLERTKIIKKFGAA